MRENMVVVAAFKTLTKSNSSPVFSFNTTEMNLSTIIGLSNITFTLDCMTGSSEVAIESISLVHILRPSGLKRSEGRDSSNEVWKHVGSSLGSPYIKESGGTGRSLNKNVHSCFDIERIDSRMRTAEQIMTESIHFLFWHTSIRAD